MANPELEKFFGSLPLSDLSKGCNNKTFDEYGGYLKLIYRVPFGSNNKEFGITTTKEYISHFYNPLGVLALKETVEVGNSPTYQTAIFYYDRQTIEYRLIYSYPNQSSKPTVSELYLLISHNDKTLPSIVARFNPACLYKVRILLDSSDAAKKIFGIDVPEAIFTFSFENQKVRLWTQQYDSKGFTEHDFGETFLSEKFPYSKFKADSSNGKVTITRTGISCALELTLPQRIKFNKFASLMNGDKKEIATKAQFTQIPLQFPAKLDIK